LEENIRLNRTLVRSGIATPAPPSFPGSLHNQYCLANKCFSPTEFALFGIGILVVGALVGILGVAWFRNYCVAEDKYYSYNVADYEAAASSSSGGRGHKEEASSEKQRLVANGVHNDSSMISNDSGGFRSRGDETVAAVTKRDSFLMSQDDIIVMQPEPQLGNDSVRGGNTATLRRYGSDVLETMM
jgi:hypothetical protein